MICLIPFRKGSKRIPDKNMKLLNDMELYKYTLYVALESKAFSKIILATDYPQELFSTHIMKHPEIEFYARSEVDDIQDANFYINEIIENLKLPLSESICLLQVTCPLRTVVDIRTAKDVYEFGKLTECLDGLLSITEAKPAFKLYTTFSGRLSPEYPGTKSRDMIYYRNSSIYIFSIQAFLEKGLDCIYNSLQVGYYEMPPERSVDIDTQEDFDHAAILLRGGVFDGSHS
jgi:CMP-N-acetylneuraminic acid synthetase